MLRTTAFACLSFVVGFIAHADEPLHVRIDRQLSESATTPLAATCSDAGFLRRVSLDLTGTLPSPEAARNYLDDTSPDKRARLIDALIGSPEYIRHMVNSFDVMLMERRADKHVSADEWRAYLRTSFEQNKPWNTLASEILGADGVDPAKRAPVKFYLERAVEPNLLTRDIGRVFFGMDLQCAQCHDHPLIENYFQSDYYGLFAFVNRSSVFTDGKAKKSYVADKAEGDASFKSVFTEEADNSRPRLPGESEIAEPSYRPGDEYSVKPAKNVRHIPKYSRRARLGELVAAGTNRAFQRNIANRLWAQMMGRGLVHPVDLHHPDNPPSHPVVLDMITDHLVASKFDMRGLLRELALTQAYQRGIDPSLLPEGFHERAGRALTAAETTINELKPELDKLSEQWNKADEAVGQARELVVPVRSELANARKAVLDARKASDDAANKLAESNKQLNVKKQPSDRLQAAVAGAKAALDVLPGDAELKAAFDQLAARANKQAAEAAAIAKTVADQTTAAKAATDKLKAADGAFTAAETKFKTTEQPLQTARINLVRILAERQALQTKLAAIDARAASLRDTGSFRQRRQQADNIRADRSRVLSQLTDANTQLQQVAATIETTRAELATARSEAAKVAGELATLTTQLGEHQKMIAAVTASRESVGKALTMLEGEADLAQMNEELSAVLERRRAEAQSFETQIAQRNAAEQQLADRLVALPENLRRRMDEQSRLDEQLAAFVRKSAELQANIDQQVAEANEIHVKLIDHASREFSVASLKPLTPEQLAWSMMDLTGFSDVQRAAAEAEFNKKNPLDDATKNDPAKMAERKKQIAKLGYDKLKGQVDQFVKLFGAGSGQPQGDFFATVDQALFFANGSNVRGWLGPSGDKLMARLNKQTDTAALAEELYLAVLTRRPTADEVHDVTEYINARPKERLQTIQEIAWALLTSTEFRFNH